MEKAKKAKSRIPRFKSYEEEAAFWDTHDTTEFEDEWKEVKLEFGRPLIHTLGVRLDARTIDRLQELGSTKGLGASTLARMWLLERLEQEASKKASAKPSERHSA